MGRQQLFVAMFYRLSSQQQGMSCPHARRNVGLAHAQ